MAKCYVCHTKVQPDKETCSKKCTDILRLRNRAIKQLVERDERLFGEGYDSEVKRAWVSARIEAIGNGTQDEELYVFWLKKQ
ncbi:MAG TPA: hypothetical protein VFD55_03020 [Candidatus Angelobacter sp.]|nr:hypothetical protein [Candidatus Angelobacter sp.]